MTQLLCDPPTSVLFTQVWPSRRTAERPTRLFDSVRGARKTGTMCSERNVVAVAKILIACVRDSAVGTSYVAILDNPPCPCSASNPAPPHPFPSPRPTLSPTPFHAIPALPRAHTLPYPIPSHPIPSHPIPSRPTDRCRILRS